LRPFILGAPFRTLSFLAGTSDRYFLKYFDCIPDHFGASVYEQALLSGFLKSRWRTDIAIQEFLAD
jgi:hypothetical protein